MTPERWQKVQQILAEAAAVPPESKNAFLEEACRGDRDLRAEIESLLSSVGRASPDFLESPAIDAVPELSPSGPKAAAPSISRGARLGHYEVLGLLGSGGMGEVYRARDERLKRDVAIKVLPQSVAGDPEALARFEREALAVAALSHPNILAIYDFGTQDGTAYAVTELLEGESLSAKLASGPIPAKQAIDYALQISKGLVAAHERGVVHRDLKPDNVFVGKDGFVKILDFGLAKRVEEAPPGQKTSAPTGSGHTTPGTVMGTAGYMSPEQVRGLPVDHRSDIFSFGTILYELVSGRKAFKRETASDTMAAIMRDEPPELSESGRCVPVVLDHIVKRCLEKDRDSRFQSARDITIALSEASDSTASVKSGAQTAATAPRRKGRLRIAAAVIAVLAVAGLLWSRRAKTGTIAPGVVKRVAVLPFENLGSPEDDYFTDGIADEVRGKLTSVPGLQVIARGSSTPYKKTAKTPNQIARELDAAYLLTATVRWEKSGGTSRVHVSPELVEVSGSGAPTSKWQQPFDASLTDVFQVQSEIATKVAQSLGAALGAGEEKRLSEKPTENLAAYDAFLKGSEAEQGGAAHDPPSLRKALGFYERAVALDPGFGQAWAALSMGNSLLYANSTPTPQLAERAREAAEKAVGLAPNRPEGYQSLGDYERLVVGDNGRALEQCAKGQRLNPANADLLGSITFAEMSLGRWDAAVEHRRQGERLDPRSVSQKRGLGEVFLRLRRYAEAREAFDRALALAPANLGAIRFKAMTFLGEGDLAAARAVLAAAPKTIDSTTLVAFLANYDDLVWVLDEGQRELLLRLTSGAFDDDRGTWALCLAQAYTLKGDTANVHKYAEEARKAYEEELRARPDDAQRHVILGVALAYLGRKEEAIREGQRGVELLPVAKDAVQGSYNQHQLVRVYILVGEQEKALDVLEPLLKIPYYLSPGWLKIDPNFDSLRQNPRFQKLVAGK
jgi:serine/threonine-protein kinase